MTAKAMCLRIKVSKKLQAYYRNIATLGRVLHTLLKLKKGEFKKTKKTLTRRFGSDARGDVIYFGLIYIRYLHIHCIHIFFLNVFFKDFLMHFYDVIFIEL